MPNEDRYTHCYSLLQTAMCTFRLLRRKAVRMDENSQVATVSHPCRNSFPALAKQPSFSLRCRRSELPRTARRLWKLVRSRNLWKRGKKKSEEMRKRNLAVSRGSLKNVRAATESHAVPSARLGATGCQTAGKISIKS